ncbi:hypothetical protein ON010_g2090 [Phytophthora cinnamomi]|nr:hypothetical protein ON010_g2090 [Phytophthora cinnamomi]
MRTARDDRGPRAFWVWGRSQPIALTMNNADDGDDGSSASSVTASDTNFSRFSTTQLTFEQRGSTFTSAGTLPSEAELLRRARSTHADTDFSVLLAGPEQGDQWQYVQTVDRFSVFQRQRAVTSAATAPHTIERARLEVLCTGRLNASLDEVARILRPDTEADHNAAMKGLYEKSFIFGSIERKVPCTRPLRYGATETVVVEGEQLAVKTSSFIHTALFAHNEQWCYIDFFQRNPGRDGFTISQRALGADESTPGRVVGAHARVHQLHGLAASYVVEQLPERQGLRVVFHSWFDAGQPSQSSSRRGGRRRSFSDSTTNASAGYYRSEAKARARRLLALAYGIAQLPECVRRHRFSIQAPGDQNALQTDNARCPCCTCSLSTVKLTLATVLSDWKRLKKKRCYLCGYLVCGSCWFVAQMETGAGRVASIVACTRCHTRIETIEPGSVDRSEGDEGSEDYYAWSVLGTTRRASFAPVGLGLSASEANRVADSDITHVRPSFTGPLTALGHDRMGDNNNGSCESDAQHRVTLVNLPVMNLSRVRTMFEEAGRRRRQGWGGSWGGSDNASNLSRLGSSPTPSISTQQSDDDIQQEALRAAAGLSDQAMLDRARAAHNREDFASLSAGPEANGPWTRVEGGDRFVVFRRSVTGHSHSNDLEVMCAGRLDASIEEVASILRSSSEIEHNASMAALYSKSFIFGSYEREVSCCRDRDPKDNQVDNVADDDSGEQLAVKTKSFARTTLLGRNEQWCYFDYFLRKKERDGFTICKRALPPLESTPGRIVGENAHVNQLHGLNASYLVDKLPNRKGLRVVFHAWFDSPEAGKSRGISRSASSPGSGLRSKSFDYGDMNKHKAHMRRLLAMAHGVMNLPDLIRRRRFGVQIPADLGAVHALNSRCPCCTHSLSLVKSTLAKAASAFTSRSLAPLKVDTRRCYLCGYLVCVNCWSAEHMESVAGRVAAIVVCVRCQANVQACEYAEVFAGTAAEREKHRGPPRVVEDSNNTPTVSLLIDFLTASLLNATAGSSEHAAVMAVIRTLLRQNEEDSDEDSDNNEYERNAPRFKVFNETEAVKKIGDMLSDDQLFPTPEACKLGNAQQRSYLLDLPEDPTADVPRSPIPSNEVERIASIKSAGLLELANLFAPETPPTEVSELKGYLSDVHDLELLCHLAVKTLGCAYSFVTVMCAKHEHVMFGTDPGFVGAAVPREQTSCQHALMSPYPFMATHQEADVRFHKQGAISAVPIRFYLGFPLKLPIVGGKFGDGEVTVGMLCCIDSKPRAEITRLQYATMTRLASTATHFLLQKGRQMQQQQLHH